MIHMVHTMNSFYKVDINVIYIYIYIYIYSISKARYLVRALVLVRNTYYVYYMSYSNNIKYDIFESLICGFLI